MKFGDTIRIEMLDAGGKSIFGAINQQVVQSVTKKMRHSSSNGIATRIAK
jgi:fumarylacetoacetate (FAA) hydrolase